MRDLVIRGGTVVDGSGAPRFTGDIAIDGGRLTQVGGTAGAARRVIAAAGALVTPGWVDVHTHYDGQVTWDPYLTPSSWHGVTTAVMGNCGVGFAPVRPDRRDWLIGLMEGVEDIPGAALAEGIDWQWETFAQYLDALDAKPLAVDVAAQVPHGALRVYAMGDRGAAEDSVATADDIAAMAAELRSGLRAGALGFSTSRTLIHRGADGVLVPGTHAHRDELFGLGRVLGELGHGVFQMTSNHLDMLAETDWMMDLARETGRPVLFNLQQVDPAPDLWKALVTRLDEARAQGVPLIGSIPGRPACCTAGVRRPTRSISTLPGARPRPCRSGSASPGCAIRRCAPPCWRRPSTSPTSAPVSCCAASRRCTASTRLRPTTSRRRTSMPPRCRPPAAVHPSRWSTTG